MGDSRPGLLGAELMLLQEGTMMDGWPGLLFILVIVIAFVIAISMLVRRR